MHRILDELYAAEGNGQFGSECHGSELKRQLRIAKNKQGNVRVYNLSLKFLMAPSYAGLSCNTFIHQMLATQNRNIQRSRWKLIYFCNPRS